MRISTLPQLGPSASELGVVFASAEGVEPASYDECLHELEQRAHALGANAIVGVQLVQSQFQWNARTTMIGTAIKE